MTVVILDPRRPTLVPLQALKALTGEVAFTPAVPASVVGALVHASPYDEDTPAATLVTTDRNNPGVLARVVVGEEVIDTHDAPGSSLTEAIDLVINLRKRGPWEGSQTHESLLRYQIEETWEFVDAVASGDRDELRAELADLLLQVLFHTAIASEHAQDPFDLDAVAQTLVNKLKARAPQLAGDTPGVPLDIDQQKRDWLAGRQRQAVEGGRLSCMDGISPHQPALVLAEKIIERARDAGMPDSLIPDDLRLVRLGGFSADPRNLASDSNKEDDDNLSASVDCDESAETRVRRIALDYADRVRQVERSGKRSGD